MKKNKFLSMLLGWLLILLTVTLSSDVALALPIPLPATIAYVVNLDSDDVSVIDVSNNAVIATILVGYGPQRVAFSPDGSRAYVTNSLSDDVSVISTFTSTEIDVDGNPGNGITRIPVGTVPLGIEVSPDGTKVYVANPGSNNMSVIDTATNTVTATFAVPGGPVGDPNAPAFTPDGSQVWVGGGGGTNIIKRFDFPSNTDLGTIGGIIGSAVRIEFLPDGSFAFVQNACGQCGNLQKISTVSNSVVSTLFYGTNGHSGMAIAPDGSDVYASTGGGIGAQVREINPVSMSITGSFATPPAATGIAFSPDGSFLYVTTPTVPGEVLVVDRSTLMEVTTIVVGDGPSDIAITTLVPLEVQIDIKPGSDPNCFNNDGYGVIPVAILGSDGFDVTEIDPASVMLEGLTIRAVGKSNKLLSHIEDSNNDGFDDMVIQIEDDDGVFTSGSGIALLMGELFDGTPIEGTDDICIVP